MMKLSKNGDAEMASSLVSNHKLYSTEMANETSSPVDSKKELLKNTIARGLREDEFELFCLICKRTGLDPFMKQVYPVKRRDYKNNIDVMTIQTSIDGFRAIAERTSSYAPGKESSYAYDSNGKLLSATSYIKKMTNDGEWHEVAATAFFEEYCQRGKDGEPTQFWKKMPHVMLAKCAEALALRKAFPSVFSKIYTEEEMQQAVPIEPSSNEVTKKSLIGQIISIIGQDESKRTAILGYYKANSFANMSLESLQHCLDHLNKKELQNEIS